MNTNNLATLVVIENLITIKVSFDGTGKLYTYKTVDDTIEIGDKVIVKVGELLKLTVVEKIDKVADLNKNIDYKWIIQKVDFTKHNELVEIEANVSEKLRDLEQESLVNNAKAMLSDKLGITDVQLLNKLKE